MSITMNEAVKNIENLTENEAKQKLIELINDGYILLEWPYSQEVMDEEWFDEEAVLADYDKCGSSAYFIPVWRTF